MKLIISKDFDVPPENRVVTVEDKSNYLSGVDITLLVNAIVRFAMPQYTKDNLKTYAADGIEGKLDGGHQALLDSIPQRTCMCEDCKTWDAYDGSEKEAMPGYQRYVDERYKQSLHR